MVLAYKIVENGHVVVRHTSKMRDVSIRLMAWCSVDYTNNVIKCNFNEEHGFSTWDVVIEKFHTPICVISEDYILVDENDNWWRLDVWPSPGVRSFLRNVPCVSDCVEATQWRILRTTETYPGLYGSSFGFGFILFGTIVWRF